MEQALADNVLRVCSILNKHTVQYMLVGGTAVALHGYYRLSTNSDGLPADKPDLDLWYNPTYPNYFKLLEALEEIGLDVTLFKEEVTPDPKKSFFKLQFDEFSLDFLPEIKGSGKFINSFEKRETILLRGVEISYISLTDLIKNKQETARDKDITDIEELKKLDKDNS